MYAIGGVCPILSQGQIILFLTELRGVGAGKCEKTKQNKNKQDTKLAEEKCRTQRHKAKFIFLITKLVWSCHLNGVVGLQMYCLQYLRFLCTCRRRKKK